MKRNRSSTYSDKNPIYFITSTVTEKLPIFFDEKICNFFLKELDFYRNKYKFAVYAYVIMPTHIHLLLQQLGDRNISDFMKSFLGITGKWITKYYLGQVGAGAPTLTGKTTSGVRVGTPVPTAKKYLDIFQSSAQKYTKKHGSNYQLWQERFDDVLVWSDEQFNIKFDYIHNNPTHEKWQLASEPQEYKYSSARNYYLDDDSIFRVDRLEI